MLTLQEKYETHVIRQDGCWDWLGKARLSKAGYPCLFHDKRPRTAHRVAWQIYHGKIPSGKYISHTCGNPRCSNPEHLEAVTASQLVAATSQRGHWRGGRKADMNSKRQKQFARKRELHRAREILLGFVERYYATGELTMKDIGRMCQRSESAISRILSRERLLTKGAHDVD